MIKSRPKQMNCHTEFELFFARCIYKCVNDHLGPDDYRWNLSEPGVWRDLFESGASVDAAIEFVFGDGGAYAN